MRGGLLFFGILNCAVGDPLNDIRLQGIVLDCPGNCFFNDIPTDIALVAGLFQAVPLARVIVMQGTAARGTGYANHWTFAVAAV